MSNELTNHDPSCCQTCGLNWTDHDGISATCAEVKRLRDALYEIHMVSHITPGGRKSHVIENKRRRQLIIVTHNPNVMVNGDAEMAHAFDFRGGQCRVIEQGALQEKAVREEVCRVMEGGREAFSRRWARLGREV